MISATSGAGRPSSKVCFPVSQRRSSATRAVRDEIVETQTSVPNLKLSSRYLRKVNTRDRQSNVVKTRGLEEMEKEYAKHDLSVGRMRNFLTNTNPMTRVRVTIL